jgi:hypothetical protein
MDDLVDPGFIVLGGPLSDEVRVVQALEAESEEAVRARLAADPWSGSYLVVDSVEPWTIRLDGLRPRLLRQPSSANAARNAVVPPSRLSAMPVANVAPAR